MSIPLYQVDSFTHRPFTGNPAAVCMLQQPADALWMQQVAAEMNLAETAFVYPVEDRFHLQWFTPVVEVDLCGHATLAAAHILWQQNLVPAGTPITFESRSGLLLAEQIDDRIRLNFPIDAAKEFAAVSGLLESLGITPIFVGRNRDDFLIEVATADELHSIKPDFRALGKVRARGVIVTCVSDDPKYDFLSRFFGPASGIDEDPVTGSAHCTLGEYWSNKLNKTKLSAYQASARGGEVQVEIEEDRALISGQAVTVFEGTLLG
ncbi:MAG: oxidoreductase [Blastopirellula sp.]|nr:MAG: oxidoreductase [Blastopirellula sp.]